MTAVRAVLALLASVALLAGAASAHEVKPAYLELRETGPDAFEVFWKVPARGDGMRLAVQLELPSDAERTGPVRASLTRDARVERFGVRRAGGLTGAGIGVRGLEAARTDALARVERIDGRSQVERLTAERASFTVEAAAGPWQVMRAYLVLGVEHILLGADHLLFVLGLLVLVRGGRRLVATITAFTLAHSLTLAAATLGAVRVPGPPVEAVIALSIAFVAREIAARARSGAGAAARAPWLVAFAFGLLHGFGFAGALRDSGLPEHAVPLALACFNVGVELGQLCFVAAVASAAALVGARALREWEALAGYAIGAIAAGLLIERSIGLL